MDDDNKTEAGGYRAPPITEALVELSGDVLPSPSGVSSPTTLDTEGDSLAMGWSVPTAARIPVALDGLDDADWHLEPHEMAF